MHSSWVNEILPINHLTEAGFSDVLEEIPEKCPKVSGSNNQAEWASKPVFSVLYLKANKIARRALANSEWTKEMEGFYDENILPERHAKQVTLVN